MKPAEIEKLLGGYATGTLTPEERSALFSAALENQALFDALADEEALRELLSDPRARGELLAALQPAAPARRHGVWAWLFARPVPVALAASLAIAALSIGVLLHRQPQRREMALVVQPAEEPQRVGEMRSEAPPSMAPHRVETRQRPPRSAESDPPQPAKEGRAVPANEGPAALAPSPAQLASPSPAAPEAKSADEPAPRQAVADSVIAGRREAETRAEAAPPPPEHAEKARVARVPVRAAAGALAEQAPPFAWTLLSKQQSGRFEPTTAREFPAGEELLLRVVPPRDSHVYLYRAPNQPPLHKDVRAGEAAEFPVTGARGVSRIRIVASQTPLPDVEFRPQAAFRSTAARAMAAPAAVEIEVTFR